MTPLRISLTSLCLLALAACGSNAVDRTGTGAAIGAASGAAVGSLFFGIGAIPGALIGGGIGAGAGAVSDEDDFNLGRPVYRWGGD